MPNKRARITDDNDPLSSTDEVLAGFQQLSQSTSQPEDQSKSQKSNKLTRKQADKSESQQPEQLESGDVELGGGQKEEKQQVNQSARRKFKKSTSQLVELSTSEQGTKEMTSQQDEKSACQHVDKSKLRKVTFQIEESVVNRLDKLHLQLQLELGKANAPYKEVIVEEAISRLLEEVESNPDKCVESLQERQRKRK